MRPSPRVTSTGTMKLRATHPVTFRALSGSPLSRCPPVRDLPLQATSPGPLLCSQASFAHSGRQEKWVPSPHADTASGAWLLTSSPLQAAADSGPGNGSPFEPRAGKAASQCLSPEAFPSFAGSLIPALALDRIPSFNSSRLFLQMPSAS